MTTTDLLFIHFEETRRRSLNTWKAIAPEFYSWQPDKDAMTALEMVRHVLESEHLYHIILQRNGSAEDYVSPWTARPYSNLQNELEFAAPFRANFLAAVQNLRPADLTTTIIRPDVAQKSNLGTYLLKIAYHEAVHTGQLLSYLRTLGIKRPIIWD